MKRMTLCYASPREPSVGDPDAATVDPRASFQDAGRDGRDFCRSAGALANSVEAALRCAYRPLTRKPILPRFSGANGDDEVAEAAELVRQAEAGLAARAAKAV